MQRRTLFLFPLVGAAMPAAGSDLVPLSEAARRVEARYLGRMIEAEARPGRPHEHASVVYELRWLTPAGQVLRIRVAAEDGALLEVSGAGMIEARRP